MSSQRETVSIAGKIYDANTGELLRTVTTEPIRGRALDGVRRPRSAQTLNRDFVKNPTITRKQPVIINHQTLRSSSPTTPQLRHNNFANRQIRRFADLNQVKQSRPKQPVVIAQTSDTITTISYQDNQSLQQQITKARQADFLTRYRINQISRQRRAKELALRRQTEQLFNKQNSKLSAVSNQQLIKQNRLIKNSLLTKAIANAPSSQQLVHDSAHLFKSKRQSFWAGLACLALLAGYLTYLNAPDISIKIAASQAGINATFPEYSPNNYHLGRLASFDDGKVVIKYHNQNKKIILTQQASQWDSQTVLQKLVKQRAGDNYFTDQTKGLTIYTYNNRANWVNGGILYDLSFDDLSNDQVHKIATSL